MSDVVSARAPGWLRIVAVLGLLWNLYGIYQYLKTVGVLPGAEAAAAAVPGWAQGAFAVAVFGGAIGCLGLLMLKRWSKLMLVISLISVLALDLWIFLLSGMAVPAAELGVQVAVLVVAILLVWLAYTADRRGWLG